MFMVLKKGEIWLDLIVVLPLKWKQERLYILRKDNTMKKLTTMILALVLALNLAIPALAATEAETAVEYLVQNGIFRGDANGNLNLDKGLKREELAVLLTRIRGDEAEVIANTAKYAAFCKFSDVDAWAKPYVGYCVDKGLLTGYTNGRFGSKDMVTQAAAYTVILRFLGYVDGLTWSYETAGTQAGRIGLAVSGAMGFSTTATTTGDGYIIMDGKRLPFGNYKVTEITAPDGFVLNSTPQTIHWSGVTNMQMTFVNVRKPGFVITKIDSNSGVSLSGAKFDVFKDGKFITSVEVNSNGMAYVNGLEEGYYEVVETVAPSGYVLDTTRHGIHINPYDPAMQDDPVLIVTNSRKSTLTIIKTDSETGKPLTGARFEVKVADGTALPGSPYTTDTNGKITIPNLDPIKLSITEITAPSGYVIDDPAAKIVTITAGKDSEISFTNTRKPSLTIHKIDSITGDPIKGAHFELWQAEGGSLSGTLKSLGKFYTDENGEITLTLQEIGWVRTVEVAPATGYGMKEPAAQDVFLEAGTSKTLHFENIPLSALIIRKVDSDTGLPVQSVSFRVRYLGGTSGSGGTIIFEGTTSHNGTIVITGLNAGTYVVEEYKAAPGYEISNPSTKTAYLSGNDQDVVTLEFANAKMGNVVIRKLDSVTKQPLAGATFKVTNSSGAVIGPNNGEYITDAEGLINIGEHLSIGSTVVVQEIKPPVGYTLDTTAQTIKIKENTTHLLTFYNTPAPGLQILKLDEETRRPIAGVEFRISKMNGEVIGNYRTDSNGLIHLPDLADGWYSATETKSASGYLLDSSAHNIELKDGKTALLTITNKKASGILIHKIDSATKKGIYGVTFLLYDASNNPVGQYESDQSGYVFIGGELPEGRYRIRELTPARGYIGDDIVRTVYLEYGRTTEITWENTAEKGQIIITKKSAQYNEVTGLPAGSLLPGAVFEVYSLTGNLVDRMVSDSRGIAASQPIPLGVYIVKEVSPAKYYAINPREFIAELRHNGDIVRFEVLNENVSLGVTIQKKGQNQAVPGQMLIYDMFNIKNTSTAPLQNFYVHDRLPTDAVRGAKVFTGTWSDRLTYQVTYKTNYSSDYRVLASGLSTKTSYELSIHPNVLGLQSGEYVTDIRWEFGTVPAGFSSAENPKIQVQVLPTLPKGYKIINRADVGGLYLNEWETAQTSWTILTYSGFVAPELPKTGF